MFLIKGKQVLQFSGSLECNIQGVFYDSACLCRPNFTPTPFSPTPHAQQRANSFYMTEIVALHLNFTGFKPVINDFHYWGKLQKEISDIMLKDLVLWNHSIVTMSCIKYTKLFQRNQTQIYVTADLFFWRIIFPQTSGRCVCLWGWQWMRVWWESLFCIIAVLDVLLYFHRGCHIIEGPVVTVRLCSCNYSITY